MNEYEFEFETSDGWYSIYRTWAACKVAAYEDLTAYLEGCGIGPAEVTVLNCYVVVAEGDEEA